MPKTRTPKRKSNLRRSVPRKTTKKPKSERLYQANPAAPFFDELRNLILKISPPSFPYLERGLKKIGRLKLVVVTGVFLNINSARVDLMVVGDDIDYKKFNNFIKNLENDLGLELRYVVLGTEEFLYRYDMFDRFVRDILEYPHKKLINRIKELK